MSQETNRTSFREKRLFETVADAMVKNARSNVPSDDLPLYERLADLIKEAAHHMPRTEDVLEILGAITSSVAVSLDVPIEDFLDGLESQYIDAVERARAFGRELATASVEGEG